MLTCRRTVSESSITMIFCAISLSLENNDVALGDDPDPVVPRPALAFEHAAVEVDADRLRIDDEAEADAVRLRHEREPDARPAEADRAADVEVERRARHLVLEASRELVRDLGAPVPELEVRPRLARRDRERLGDERRRSD